MTSENCPFVLCRQERSDEDSRKDKFCKFQVPVNVADVDGPKIIREFKKLGSDDPEDVLQHLFDFADLVDILGTGQGPPRFRLFGMTLCSSVKNEWDNIRSEYVNDDHDTYVACIDEFLLTKMTRDIAVDTKEWLNNVKKPRNWRVSEFMTRVKQINSLFDYMPLPADDSDEADRVPGFTEAELLNILKKASPKEWREAQVRSNQRFDTVAQQVQYYEGLRNLEKLHPGNKNDHGKRNGKKGGGKHNPNPKNDNKSDPICPIHGTHLSSQCETLKKMRREFLERKNNRNNGRRSNSNGNGGGGSGSNNHRYNTRNNRQRQQENNNIHDKDREEENAKDSSDSSEENYMIEEEIHVLNADDVEEDIKKAASGLNAM